MPNVYGRTLIRRTLVTIFALQLLKNKKHVYTLYQASTGHGTNGLDKESTIRSEHLRMSQATSEGSWQTTVAGPFAIADSSHPTSLRTVLRGSATFLFRVLGVDCRVCAVAGFKGTLPTGKSQLEAFATPGMH